MVSTKGARHDHPGPVLRMYRAAIEDGVWVFCRVCGGMVAASRGCENPTCVGTVTKVPGSRPECVVRRVRITDVIHPGSPGRRHPEGGGGGEVVLDRWGDHPGKWAHNLTVINSYIPSRRTLQPRRLGGGRTS